MRTLLRLLGRRDDSDTPSVRRERCDIDAGEEGRSSESWYVPADVDPGRFLGSDGQPTLRLVKYRDSAGERVLRLVEDETGLLVGPTHRGLVKVGVYVSQLRGETYYEASCRRGNFAPGAKVCLVREPENPHDPNAVAVYDATGRHRAAYINKQKARTLARLMDGGVTIEAVSLRGTATGQECPQVAIVAAEPHVLRRLLSPRPKHLPSPAHLR